MILAGNPSLQSLPSAPSFLTRVRVPYGCLSCPRCPPPPPPPAWVSALTHTQIHTCSGSDRKGCAQKGQVLNGI